MTTFFGGKLTLTAMLHNISVADKNELLHSCGINYNDVPTWQKRGVGIAYKTYQKEGVNLLTQEKTLATRRKLQVYYNLPLGVEYADELEVLL